MKISSDQESKVKGFSKISTPLIFSTILIVAVVITLGILNYFHTQANLSIEAFHNLENISKSKISSITYWRKDKIDDARTLMNDLTHREFLNDYEKGKTSDYQIKSWLQSLINHNDVREIILYDTKKTPLASNDRNEYIIERERLEAYNKCLSSKNVFMSDIYTEDSEGALRLAIFIPIFKTAPDTSTVNKILMIEFDLSKGLDKFIEEWPVETESSEAYLIRNEDNNVLYLTETKHLKNYVLNNRLPKTDTNLISVRAVNGLRGNYRGYDYSRKDVHVFINDVPETNWILVTKTDTIEIRKDAMIMTGYVFIITFVIVILALLITYLINRRNKDQFFKELYKNEHEKNIELQRFNVLLNNAYDSIILYDHLGNVLEANNSALNMYGYTLEEMKKLNITDIRAPEKRIDINKVLNSLHKSEGMMIETLHQTKEGKVFAVEVSASKIEFGGEIYLQGISRDITSRKLYESLLRESEEKFKSVFTYANDSMFIMDEKRFLTANKNSESLFGYSADELTKLNTSDVSPQYQEDGQLSTTKAKEYIKKALNGEPQFFEWIHKNSDGAEFPTEVSLNMITINGNKQIFAVVRDITFRKILDTTLKEKEKSLELALDSSELGYYDFNILTEKAITNKELKIMLGYSDEDIQIDFHFLDSIIHEADAESVKQAWEDYVSEKTTAYQIEYRVRIKDGSYKWVLDMRKVFERTAEGKPSRIVGTFMDITQRKAYEDAILNAKEAAEESNNLKSNFLTNMSHELRTPLTGILGFSELLGTELEDEEQKEMAELIFRGGKRLTNTLNSILDLSRLESNQLSASMRTENLVTIIEETIMLHQKNAESKGLTITFENDFETLNCSIDEKMMNDIVSNLLHNAVTYTKKGSINVKLEITDTDTSKFVKIKVKDTGIGVNPKYHKQIFEPFRQASEGLSRKFEGTGLGLTLTKKYTEMMGGEISIISSEGSGAEFIVTIPFESYTYKNNEVVKVSQGISSVVSSDTSDKKEINAVFIEDEIENFELLNMLLKPYMELKNIASSKDAIERIKEQQYDVVFMDIGLKEINGMEVTRIIRKLDNYKETPIIAITAFAMEGDKEKILESGCDEYISKPFTKEQLFDVLKKFKILENLLRDL